MQERGAQRPAVGEHCRHAHRSGERAHRNRRRVAEHRRRTCTDAAQSSPLQAWAVAPCGELRAPGIPDAYQIEAVRKRGQSDVVRRDAHDRVAIAAFTRLHRFPSLFEWRQVPVSTGATDHPEPTALRVEGQASSHLKLLELDVPPEVCMTEQTGGIHDPSRGRRGQARSRCGTSRPRGQPSLSRCNVAQEHAMRGASGHDEEKRASPTGSVAVVRCRPVGYV